MKITNYKLLITNKGPKLPKQGGFTLLETLVAIIILITALDAMFSLVSKSFFTSKYANNEITATYLAQEAVDYIRNDRDTTAFQHLGGGTWESFLNNYGYPDNNACFSSDGCYLEASNPDPNIISSQQCSGTCPVFFYDSEPIKNVKTSYYTYDPSFSATPTTFRRTIKLSLNPKVPSLVAPSKGIINPDNELDIVVTVEWENGNTVHSQVLHASLLKWQ